VDLSGNETEQGLQSRFPELMAKSAMVSKGEYCYLQLMAQKALVLAVVLRPLVLLGKERAQDRQIRCPKPVETSARESKAGNHFRQMLAQVGWGLALAVQQQAL